MLFNTGLDTRALSCIGKEAITGYICGDQNPVRDVMLVDALLPL